MNMLKSKTAEVETAYKEVKETPVADPGVPE